MSHSATKIEKGVRFLAVALLAVLALSHSVAALLLGGLLLVRLLRGSPARALFLRKPGGAAGDSAAWLGAFLLWAAGSTAFHHVGFSRFGAFYYYTPVFLAPLFFRELRREDWKRIVLASGALSSLLVLAAALSRLADFQPPGTHWFFSGRLRGFAGHPIPAASLFASAALPALAYGSGGGDRPVLRRLFRIFFVVNMLGLLMTQSRGYFVAVGLVLLVYFLSASGKRDLALPLILVAGLLAVSLVLTPGLPDRFRSLFDPGYESNRERIVMWKVGWAVFTGSPGNVLTGIGVGGWAAGSKGFFAAHDPSMLKLAWHAHVHNVYLQTAVETGIVGLSLYIGFLVSLIRPLVTALRRTGRTEPDPELRPFVVGALLVAGSYLIAGLFDYLHNPVPLISLYFTLALGNAAARRMQA